MLEKAGLLCTLRQWDRSLAVCRLLLSLPNLDPRLHERVISQLWAPFNDAAGQREGTKIHVGAPVDVRSVSGMDSSEPAFWGFAAPHFREVCLTLDQVSGRAMKRDVSIESWLTDSSAKTSRTVYTVGVGQRVVIAITVLNRHQFAVHLDEAEVKVKGDGGCAVSRLTGQLVKPLSSSILRFEFVPEAEGKFKVDSLKLSYWACCETEVSLGDLAPVVLHCVESLPHVALAFEGLPEIAFSREHITFEVVVTNTGQAAVPSVMVTLDGGRNCVVTSGAFNALTGECLVLIAEGIEVGEVRRWTLTCRMPRQAMVLHAVAGLLGTRCAFAAAHVKVQPAADLLVRRVDRITWSHESVVFCRVRSIKEDVVVSGMVGRSGAFVKVLGEGEAVKERSLLAFVAEPDDKREKASDSIQAFLGEGRLAVCLSVGGRLLQENLGYEEGSKEGALSIRLDQQGVLRAAEVVTVRVVLCARAGEAFVQPLPVAVMELAKQKTPQRLAGCCPWIGQTRVRLWKGNNFECDVKCVPLTPGLFEVPGFLVSNDPAFRQPLRIRASCCFAVGP
jgi:hypothetical protein